MLAGLLFALMLEPLTGMRSCCVGLWFAVTLRDMLSSKLGG